MTAQPAEPAEPAEPARPSRPALVELAAAILMVGGVAGLIQAAASSSGLPAGTEPFQAGAVALDAGSIALGLLIRTGRAWLLAVNYAAVLGFIDLLGAGATPFSLMLGLTDILVVGILLVTKPWFDAMRSWRAEVAAAGGVRRVSP
jgi:hypothetical protein